MRAEKISTWEAAQALNALRITSTILWEVKTLPPTTAASFEGHKMLPFGTITCTGFKQPWKNSN